MARLSEYPITASRSEYLDKSYDGTIRRVHQEDLAQALGLNTFDPDRKFQRGRASPSLRAAAEVLSLVGADLRPLLALATFSHLVGNTDMHAKNISFMRWDDGSAALAPAYDISAHMHHPGTPRISALYVNGKERMEDIQVDDLLAEARSWPGRLPGREQVVGGLIGRLARALTEVDRNDHPGVSAAAFTTIVERTNRAAEVLAEGGLDQTLLKLLPVGPNDADPADSSPRRTGRRRTGPRRHNR